MRQSRALIMLVALVTLAFGWVLLPFLGAVFWAIIISIIFYPLYERLLSDFGNKPHLAALAAVAIIFLIVVIPLLLIATAVFQEVASMLVSIRSDGSAFGSVFQKMFLVLPDWLKLILARIGLTDLPAVQSSLAAAIRGWIGLIAPRVFSLGQSTVSFFINLFAMLYLTFFLFQDGKKLLGYINSATPLRPLQQAALLDQFTLVVRATVKGDILVAMLQGVLGGLGFWVLGIDATILWTVLMFFLSLLPVFGAALVWLPVAVYFFANGEILSGIGLLVYGMLIIGLVDNFVRPFLIGQATKMPEFVVLFSTLGGVATFGLQGVITGPVIAALFISVWTTFLATGKS